MNLIDYPFFILAVVKWEKKNSTLLILLFRTQEDIVFVHYRELEQVQSSPITSANSNSSSAHCLNASVPKTLAEEKNCRTSHASRTSESGFCTLVT